ncbi:phosphotransferase family protein [Actinokineospora guangxiensis]|uniref:Phosphotransferase family protein n=1 Tax=Actinokineospora guangxiensis TaxID=1490288 RepID=A0ABW0EQF4_9PSEU
MTLPASIRKLLPHDPTPLGGGLDNTVYTSGNLIVRIANNPNPDALRREAALLTAIADLPVATPVPVAVDDDAGILVYHRLPGTPLLHRPRTAATLGPSLGKLLSALHSAPIPPTTRTDDTPLTDWLTDTADTYPAAAPALTPTQRRAVEHFLATPPPAPASPPVLTHSDLGAEHLLIDPDTGALTGIIDWTDATITHRAVDFGRLYRDLGPTTHSEVLAHYSPEWTEADEHLTRFFARCTLIEDLAYGLTTARHTYLSAALANFSHTF